jgi:hypothetical protein
MLLASLAAWAGPSSVITSPAPGSTFTSQNVEVQWNDSGASLYQVWVGSTQGARDLGYFPSAGTTALSTTLSGLPIDGRTLYVRLWSLFEGVYYFTDQTYTATTVGIVSPPNGATLTGSSQTFTWNDGGASLYQVWVGSTDGAYDLGYFPSAGTTELSTTVSGLPGDGRTLYVRLWSLINGVYYFKDHTYIAYPDPATTVAIVSPPNGATLTGSSQTFTWNDGGASLYQVWIGNTRGGHDLGQFPSEGTTALSTTVSGLPVHGRTLYVRLWSVFNGVYYFTDQTYTAYADPATTVAIVSPPNGATLADRSQTFTWNDAGASLYQVWVGSTQGAHDLGYFPSSGTTATSTTATGLPIDGRTLHVRLWSLFDGVYYYQDQTYTATTVGIVSPPNGATLTGNSQTFAWNDGGASLYQVWVGSALGFHDLGYFPSAGTTALSTIVSGLPVDGRTLYVRLWSLFDGVYYFKDQTYTAYSGW